MPKLKNRNATFLSNFQTLRKGFIIQSRVKITDNVIQRKSNIIYQGLKPNYVIVPRYLELSDCLQYLNIRSTEGENGVLK